MKKVLFLLLASFLVLAACGNKEESRLDDTKETKSSENDDKKKNDKKSDDTKEDKSDDEKSNEETKQVSENENTQEQPTAQENVQSQEQQAPVDSKQQVQTQEQQPVQSQEQQPVVEEQPTQQAPVQQEPTDQEKMEANAKVAKEHGYTGVPNGDVGMLEENQAPDVSSEQTYDYENNGVQRTPSQQKAHEDWVNGQNEWNNASEAEKTEIRKADAKKYGYEYDPSNYE